MDERGATQSPAAAHPRKPLVSETRGLRGWAAALPRAPALGFFGSVGTSDRGPTEDFRFSLEHRPSPFFVRNDNTSSGFWV